MLVSVPVEIPDYILKEYDVVGYGKIEPGEYYFFKNAVRQNLPTYESLFDYIKLKKRENKKTDEIIHSPIEPLLLSIYGINSLKDIPEDIRKRLTGRLVFLDDKTHIGKKYLGIDMDIYKFEHVCVISDKRVAIRLEIK